MPQTDPEQRLADLEAVCAALAHPARRQILLTIHFCENRVAAGYLAQRFSHKWPTTSRHLRVLEGAGLITFEKQGRSRYYSVVHARLDVMRTWLGWFEY
jgi:DNA-binding transcriptional ArsR family regulator